VNFESLRSLDDNRRKLRRRRFLWFGVAGAGGFLVWRWWRQRPQAVSQRPTTYVVANRDFYRVSIDPAFRPKIDLERYRLRLQGPSGTVRELRYEDLTALPTREEFRTLACVGNPVGGTGIGNAAWTVTPLGPVLEGVIPEPSDRWWVTFHGLDGFYSSIPWAAATDPATVLALRMNGEPLPAAHGFPVRVLIPGRYGMKQPRWLERIEVGEDGSGYWEKRGWCDVCELHILSRIDSVKLSSEGKWRAKGVAYCGSEAVGRVELSDDGEETWRPARLTSEALPNAWATWEFDWEPRDQGGQVLAVRAIALSGAIQDSNFSGAFPSGATGLHRVSIEVA